MSLGEKVERYNMVVGKRYKWDTAKQGMVECDGTDGYEHRDYAAEARGSSYSYHSYQPSRIFDNVDKAKWPKTWAMLVKFYFSDSYNRESKWVSDIKSNITKESENPYLS